MTVKIFIISFFSQICCVLGSQTPNLNEITESNQAQTYDFDFSEDLYASLGISQLTQNQNEHHSDDVTDKSCENYEPQTFANFTDFTENTYDHEVERMISDFSAESKLEKYLVNKNFDFEPLLSEQLFDQENIAESNEFIDPRRLFTDDISKNLNISGNDYSYIAFDNNNFASASNLQDINTQNMNIIFQQKKGNLNEMIKNGNQNSNAESFELVLNNEENSSNDILSKIVNENQDINFEITVDHTITAPLSEYFDKNKAKKIRAYLIANGYEYFVIKAYIPEKFVILRAKTDTNSMVREAKLYKEYQSRCEGQFETFKSNCCRLTTDSDGNLYLFQYYRRKACFEILVVTPDLELIKSINYKNHKKYLQNAGKVKITNLRIHSDELYLLDSEIGRILITNLDFKILNVVKIKKTFDRIKFAQLAVSNKYIAVLNNGMLYICKQNGKVKGFESFRSSSYYELDSFEFLNDNIIMAKSYYVQIFYIFKIHENDKGELFLRKGEISLFKNGFNQICHIFALDSGNNIFSACLTDDEIKISKIN